jgi:spore maturation protein CgeB
VLVIPPLLGGTLAEAYWCAQALVDLGCQVRTVPMDRMSPLYKLMFQVPHPPERLDVLRAPMMRFLGELAVLKAQEFSPHLVLALAQAPLDRRALKDLRSQGARTAFWFVEDFRHMSYFREVAASYDFFFHIQGPELMAELDRLGANHAFLPCAAHPPVHRPLALTELEARRYGGEVGFMGAGYPNRRRVFADLVARGLPLRLWGVDWPTDGPLGACLAEPNRYLDSEEVVKIYNACQIVLNLHSSAQARTGAGQVDFVNPRTLEVPACGGFQLVDRVRGLERLLVPDREVAVFEDEADLIEKARHYLDHPEERARLAQAGRRRVLDSHTYHHRLEELLTRCLGPAELDEDAQPGEGSAVEMMLERLAAQAA